MDFETIDWNAEAERIAQAFKVHGKCQFSDVPQSSGRLCKSLLAPRYPFWKRLFNRRFRHQRRDLCTRDGVYLFVSYRPANQTIECVFTLTDNWMRPRLDRDMVSVAFSHNGSVVTDALVRDDHKYGDVLAKGLFHLGLLTPEIETALQMSVSAHEKLEWTRELQERLEFETVDWEAEAKQLARAFGVVGECYFKGDGPYRPLTRPMNWFEVLRSYCLYPSAVYREQIAYHIPTEDGIYLYVHYGIVYGLSSKKITLSDSEVNYKTRARTSFLIQPPELKLVTPPSVNVYVQQMAKGLFHLDLLTPETEAALGVSVSAHEKLEWALEYEERYGL